ncbi:MAG: deoxyribose-phosphate aldolase [Phycisphaerae bacterium]|jgi:deoxyribose-phosphate aldolase|nr:deoxyribose-phosphate aldolase [Phycisphaerae bacterium]
MKVKLTSRDIARMVDLSVVQCDDDETRVRALAARAREIRPCVATTLSSWIPLIKELLADVDDVGIGGNVAFPSGACLLQTKIAETKHLVAVGCDEIDMVVDIGKLLSGRYDYCLDDIKGVVDAAAGLPVKVIIECHYLSDDQIRTAAELCVSGGASFVKTGTGWTSTGATLENISLIKSVVGDAVGIKASGGIRDLDTLVEMHRRGARRFGLGLGRENVILDQADALPGGVVEFDSEAPGS